MAEENQNIDQEYIDTTFVTQINNIDNESLRNLCTVFLEKYKTEYNYEDIEKFNQECQALFDTEVNTEHFLRQLKYLYNKGIYGRINKKFKNDLLVLGISANKIEIMSEVGKKYFDKNLEKNENDSKDKILTLKDFDMLTEMPVSDSHYELNKDDTKNDDFKKQKLLLNLRLTQHNQDYRQVIQVDKDKMIGLFEQIEKLQEQLDKLS